MPLRHQDTEVHKKQTINILNLVISLSLRAFVAKIVFRSKLNIESYIKENKHLPDIPSADEMIENGLELGDMQIKLLQKVEELTLYIIEQDKKIKKMENEVNKLKEE